MPGTKTLFIFFGIFDIEYAANTNNKGDKGEINRTSLCAMSENEIITPNIKSVYIDIGKDIRPWIEKGRYVVNKIGRPWDR